MKVILGADRSAWFLPVGTLAVLISVGGESAVYETPAHWNCHNRKRRFARCMQRGWRRGRGRNGQSSYRCGANGNGRAVSPCRGANRGFIAKRDAKRNASSLSYTNSASSADNDTSADPHAVSDSTYISNLKSLTES